MHLVIRMTVLVASMLSVSAGAAELTVDANLPAGNIVVEKIDGDTVRLTRELRDTKGDWFYWAFRVQGAKGRTLQFVFDPKVCWGGPVGVRGPAVTTDGGKTWAYPCDGKSTRNTFSYTFATDDEVRFYETWQYLPPDWESFLAAHAADLGRKFETGVLCTSRKGRAVPNARFGCLTGTPKHRIFMSSRHHCSEATATPVLEGVAAAFLKDDDLGRWLCANVELMLVPFTDYDGVVDGDQGKNRAPHDHNRDYTEFLYPETRAIRDWVMTHAGGRLDVFIDAHCPWIRDGSPKDTNEFLYTPWKDPAILPNAVAEKRYSELLEKLQCGSMRYRAADDVMFGQAWNTAKNYHQGMSAVIWACKAVEGLKIARSYEVPFANARGAVVTPQSCRDLGRDTAKVFRALLTEHESPESNIQTVKHSNISCVDGIYPHLAMSNDEDECGMGAVVPWAGSLWVVTYGPHCPVGSSDKLYQIAPDLTRVIRTESVGGTPANRLIHRETDQLLIGPYVIDAKGNVRVVPPAKMPGRLTGAGRHLADPANKVYVATMDNGLYTLDMHTLAVKTLQRDHNGVDGKIWGRPHMAGFPFTPDWDKAVDNVLPGSHTKGMCTGFGRIQLSNNGEYHPEALTNPWIPAGVLGDCAPDGTDQKVIRRCQFTDITTKDGIYGNEHPETNPVWALGWDAKSVILAVATNGNVWTYFRLPKASHCYDGAHGWNTEWPRIREAGLGDGNLLATMHGTFWKFPKDFSPVKPNGIRPISTYLKVIGDFCYWKDAPGGGSIVFGCDDHARSEFLGKRKLKADQPKNPRSTSNLWFVKPEELATFGPPTGEGWVWHGEDVKAGDLSDPYLWEGYGEREFTFVDADGRPVPHELVHAGDWVRVKALADAKGVKAHFVYGRPKPATLPALDAKRPYVDVTDDNGRTFRFPNVNGDTNVICREVATERDLLYVGGVFYELPAENAGGFACLRPITLADEPVKSIAVDRGLVVVNGKRRVLDSLWRNGTAAQAYALWREHFRQLPATAWPGFTRGMGMGGWLTNYKRFNVLPVEKRLVLTPGDYAHFDSYITEGDVARIRRWGFDHIRIGFDQIVLEEAPGKYRERTFRKLDDFIGWCGRHKMNVVLNLHKAIGNYCDIPEKVQLLDDEGLQARFIALWLEIERRYHDRPGLAFELLNEVRDVDPEKWNVLADRTLKAIRAVNPYRWVVIGPTTWNHPGKLAALKVWDDPKVVYTFHMYWPHGFTHQRGVLQAGPLYENAEVPYPGTATVQAQMKPAVDWIEAHPGKILWNGEFGTIRHMNPFSRVAYMRDVIAVCRRSGMPWCVWNYLSTPNDGNRFSLVDDETRDFLSDALRRACLGEGDAAARGELTYMTMNIWGAYFGNPVWERDLKQVAYVRRMQPDLLGLQEAMPDFWKSRLFTELGKDYGIIRAEGNSQAELNPLLWRRERLDLIKGGTQVYAAKDNPEGSKGFGWGVFRDKVTGRRFIAYSTHLMWSAPQYPKTETARMRMNNAAELFAKIDALRAEYGDLPVVGGGDLNTSVSSGESGLETPLALWREKGYGDAQYVTPGASAWSSYHGDPKRDAAGELRGVIRPEASDPKRSIDHIHFSTKHIEPLACLVDRAQDALEFSDHSPVLLTFRFKPEN